MDGQYEEDAKTVEEENNLTKIPVEADFLYSYSTAPGCLKIYCFIKYILLYHWHLLQVISHSEIKNMAVGTFKRWKTYLKNMLKNMIYFICSLW